MSTPFQKVVIGGILSLGISYLQYDRAVGVRTNPQPRQDFQERSLGAKQIKWDLTKPTRSIELLATDENVLALTEQAKERSLTVKPGQQGVTDYLTGEKYHAYFHVTSSLLTPKLFRPWLANTTSYSPLRGLLSMFPPFGGEVPEVPNPSDDLVDDYGIGTTTPEQEDAQHNAIVDYRASRMDSDVPLSGAIALGNVFVTGSSCKIASNDRFVVRYMIMSTTDLHALDGRALWALVYDIESDTTMFYAVGAGQNSLPFMDRLNNHMAGHVFSTMHTSFAKALTIAEDSGGVKRLTDGVADHPRSLEILLAKDDKALAARRAMATTFDAFSRMLALMRRTTGMDVIDVPSTIDTTEQDVLSLPVPKELNEL